MDSIIRVENVSKEYKVRSRKGMSTALAEPIVRALDAVSLEIGRGEIFGLLGANGAGKTTLLKIMTGLIFPTAGRVTVADFDTSSQHEQAAEKIGAVVEEPRFYDELTGLQNLEYIAALSGCRDRSWLENAVRLVGLEARIGTLVSGYSLGMRQRLGIAQAILLDPPVLILDEPINGLDPNAIVQLRTLLRRLAEENGTTVIVSSHILSEMQELCDRAAFMKKGRVVAVRAMTDLDGDGAPQLLVECDEPARAAELVSKELGLTTAVEGRVLTVTVNDEGDAMRINKLLILNDINIVSVKNKKRTLEDVYGELSE